MGGFHLDGYYGRIPCPHCGGTDCFAIDDDNKLICSDMRSVVTAQQLEKQAKEHEMTEYLLLYAGHGWWFHVFTFVSEEFANWFEIGNVELFVEGKGVRGLCPSHEVAKTFVEKNQWNHEAYYRDV